MARLDHARGRSALLRPDRWWGGPIGLIALKIGAVSGGVALLVRTARLGRTRLARNCLLVAAAIGVVGVLSNLVG
jgi:hypothetical protein